MRALLGAELEPYYKCRCVIYGTPRIAHRRSEGLTCRMSKAPTVSEVVGKSNVTFKGVVGPPAEDGIRPDFDTDVLWKPPRLSQKSRTVSVDSTDSEGARKLSISDSSPIDVPRPRRMSITEMIFGSPAGGFSWSQGGLQASSIEMDRKNSITEDARFKELMKHQNKILGDDGITSSFKKRDYMKN